MSDDPFLGEPMDFGEVDLCPICGAVGPDDHNADCQYPACGPGCVRELGHGNGSQKRRPHP